MAETKPQEPAWGSTLEFVISEQPEEDRLDQFLTHRLETLSRHQVQRLIREGHVQVGGRPVKPNYRPRKGDLIVIHLPKPKQIELTAKPIPFEILFEDEWIVVVNKPPQLAVHPSVGHEDCSLVHGLLYACGERLSGIGGELRPGIVHRLDAGTSGVLVVAKNDAAHQALSEQFAARRVRKIYDALVCGEPRDDEGIIEAPIGRHPVDRKRMAVTPDGRYAVSQFRVLERFGNAAWLEVIPKTGRTHQIRVHLKHIGCPIIGDRLYGERANRVLCRKTAELPDRPLLHARLLGFIHPSDGTYREFTAELPQDFKSWIVRLRALKTGAGTEK